MQGVAIKIIGSGPGIADEDKAKLFTRFEQLEKAIDTQDIGTGLGLALVQELVELHQGRIFLESELGRGSVFSVWLPLVPDESRYC